MSHTFNNTIRWMELAKIHYDQLGYVVSDVSKALGNFKIRDINEALFQVAQKHEVADRDNTIFVKMRQNAHFETTTTCKTSKIVVEAKEKHVL